MISLATHQIDFTSATLNGATFTGATIDAENGVVNNDPTPENEGSTW